MRGNVDRWAGDPPTAPDDAGLQEAIADCRGALGDAVAGELGALPFEAELAGARIVHASPVSDLRSFAPEPDPEDEELLDGTTHPRLLFGHTHVQFRRPAGSADVELVNPGSVGMPLDGDPRAAYALIHPDRTLELRRVAYDTAAAHRRAARGVRRASRTGSAIRSAAGSSARGRSHRAGPALVAAGLEVAQAADAARRCAIAREAREQLLVELGERPPLARVEHRQRLGERRFARGADLHCGALAGGRERHGDGAAVGTAAALDEAAAASRSTSRTAPEWVRPSTRASASIGSPPR